MRFVSEQTSQDSASSLFLSLDTGGQLFDDAALLLQRGYTAVEIREGFNDRCLNDLVQKSTEPDTSAAGKIILEISVQSSSLSRAGNTKASLSKSSLCPQPAHWPRHQLLLLADNSHGVLILLLPILFTGTG